jgi:transposase-like protein
MFDLSDPIFHNEDAARAHFEAVRWPNGPTCPHCGNADPGQIHALRGKSHRPGLFQCNECREHFTVTVGSVMESSHIKLTKWAAAFHLMAASKKGISAHQLHRMLGITYRSAWFLAHRVREAMKDDDAGPIGGEGKIVEADETYHGRRETPKPSAQRKGRPYLKRKKPFDKRSIVALVERGAEVRMFHVQNATKAEIRDVLVRNVDRKSALHTDESALYTETGAEFADHRTVKHSAGEYVRYEADAIVHSNTVENVFSVFKRGMTGVYQHCGEAHLHRYLSEFEFRYNRRSGLGIGDTDRTVAIIKGAEGKRLTYRRTGEARHA